MIYVRQLYHSPLGVALTIHEIPSDAVINHIGGFGSGHYTAKCKDEHAGWYTYDDERAEPCRSKDIVVGTTLFSYCRETTFSCTIQ